MGGWPETETEFARQVLRFVNQETMGDVAWFTKRADGSWETSVQTSSGLCVELEAGSEEALAVAYWDFYFRRVKASTAKFGGLWHRIFSREKHLKAQERSERWIAWRDEHAADFASGTR